MKSPKENENEEEPHYVQMEMKAIRKIKNVEKLKEIADAHLEELKRIKTRGLELKEEKKRLVIHYESTLKEIKCKENVMYNKPKVIPKMEEEFEKEKLDDLCRLKYEEYLHKKVFRDFYNANVEEKLARDQFFLCEMKNISNQRNGVERAKEKYLYEWMEELVKMVSSCKACGGNEDITSIKQNDELEASETELDKLAQRNEEDLDKWKQTIALEKKVWREFQNDMQIDAYNNMKNFLDATNEEVSVEQKKILEQQFKELAILRDKVAIQSLVAADTKEKIERVEEPIELQKPSAQEDQQIRYFNTLTKKRDNLMATLQRKEQRVDKLKKVLAKLEGKST